MQAADLLSRLGSFTHIHGDPLTIQVSRVDVLQESTLPFPGTVYLCEDVQILMGWLTTHRKNSLSHQQIFILPAYSEFHFPFVLHRDLLVLSHTAQRLPIGLSMQIMQILYEENPSLKVDLDQIRSEIVSELLRGSYVSVKNLLARAKATGLDLEQKRQVILIEPENPEAAFNFQIARGEAYVQAQRAELLQAIRRTLTRHSLHHLVSLHPNRVVILLDERASTPAESITQSLTEVLAGFKGKIGYLVALGNPVKTLLDLPQSFQEALAVLEVGRIYRIRAAWSSFESQRMLVFVHRLQNNPELSSLVEAALEPLSPIEPTYRKALLESLAAYIEHSHSIQTAAKTLGIHPNTLKYRIRRLEELLDLRKIQHERQLLYYLAARIQLLRMSLS